MNKYLVFLIKISFSGILLYLILKNIDIQVLAESLKQGKSSKILAGVLIGIIFNLVKFLKWHKLIRTDSDEYSYRDSAKSYMIGNALGIVTPMRAGDLGRALYFNPGSRPRIVGFTIIDRVLDLISVVIFSIGGAFILINPGFGIILAVASMIGLVTLYNPMWIYKITNRLMFRGALNDKLAKVTESLKLLNKGLLSKSLTLSIIAFFLIIIQFYFVVSAFEEISFTSAYLATPLVTLSSLIPITFMGLGVREGLAIYLFAMLNITSATAFSTAFLCFLINNVSTGIIGIVCLIIVQSRLSVNLSKKENIS